MIRNYFKTAWRNIVRNKTTTLINLFGLSVALVTFIFISLWVHNELSFDDYHKDAKDIYLVRTKFQANDEGNPLTALPVTDALKKNHDVEYVARMARWPSTLNVDGNLFDEKTGIAVDSDWFKIFYYKIISGDINSFNSNPFSLIFTQSKAKQLFGNNNPIGRIVKLDTTLYQVSAIVNDNPVNSSLQFDMLAPMAARLAYRHNNNDWSNLSYRTFVKVYPNTDIAAFTKKATALSQQMSAKTDFSLGVQSLYELHFDTTSPDPAFHRGSHTAVFVFSLVAILLLITASINYVNLTIAKANARTREISIRKIVGANRTHLFLQFITESLLLCLIALLISVFVMTITLPAFDKLTETNFRLTAASAILWSILCGTLFISIVLNGVFPAFTMSGFKPLNYLHGNTIFKFRNILLRKALVVFQFVIGVTFIIGTAVIFRQMRLAQTSAAQYNRDQVVSFNLPSQVLQRLGYNPQKINLLTQTVKNSLQSYSCLQSIGLASNAIEGSMNSNGATGNWYWKGMDTSCKAFVSYMTADPGTNNIFNLQIKAGRWFRNDNTDKKNYILNETAVKELGIHQPVIGQVFARKGEDTGQIIGVIKDYNFSSLYHKISPLVIGDNDRQSKSDFFVKIVPGNIPKAMNVIAATWKTFIPDAPFEYQFMDLAFDNLYKDDLKISDLILLFSCISIVISALGLFGLAAFVAEQRRKEIGIRKVMGATVTQITAMIAKDFISLVFIAIVIASPIAYWLMNKWLQNFVYRINMGGCIFITAGSAAMFIAIVTVSFRSIKAALANPVKSLRTE